MDALKRLAVASAIGAWCVIVFGGFTTATGSGLGCSEAITCGETPYGAGAAQIEVAHRLVAWAEGFLVLAMFILVYLRFRAWRSVWRWTSLAFVLIIVQSMLGIVSVTIGNGPESYRSLYPFLVTTHLGVATTFLAVTVMNAHAVLRGPPPEPHRDADAEPKPGPSGVSASPPSTPSGR